MGIIHSQKVHLNRFGVYVLSRAQFAQSHQRRFRRWLLPRRLPIAQVHQALLQQALATWRRRSCI
ncbi:hypothetical protein [Trichothermofontia sp.]